MDNTELMKIISNLIELSKKDNINWTATSKLSKLNRQLDDDYTVNTMEYSINIFKLPNRNINFRIYNSVGNMTFEQIVGPRGNYYPDFKKLIGLAKKRSGNLNKILQDTERALSQGKNLGEK